MMYQKSAIRYSEVKIDDIITILPFKYLTLSTWLENNYVICFSGIFSSRIPTHAKARDFIPRACLLLFSRRH